VLVYRYGVFGLYVSSINKPYAATGARDVYTGQKWQLFMYSQNLLGRKVCMAVLHHAVLFIDHELQFISRGADDVGNLRARMRVPCAQHPMSLIAINSQHHASEGRAKLDTGKSYV